MGVLWMLVVVTSMTCLGGNAEDTMWGIGARWGTAAGGGDTSNAHDGDENVILCEKTQRVAFT